MSAAVETQAPAPTGAGARDPLPYREWVNLYLPSAPARAALRIYFLRPGPVVGPQPLVLLAGTWQKLLGGHGAIHAALHGRTRLVRHRCNLRFNLRGEDTYPRRTFAPLPDVRRLAEAAKVRHLVDALETVPIVMRDNDAAREAGVTPTRWVRAGLARPAPAAGEVRLARLPAEEGTPPPATKGDRMLEVTKGGAAPDPAPPPAASLEERARALLAERRAASGSAEADLKAVAAERDGLALTNAELAEQLEDARDRYAELREKVLAAFLLESDDLRLSALEVLAAEVAG